MGLFDKFKKKKNIAGHKEQWDFYLTNIDDKPGSITVDLGLASVAPIPNFETIVWVSVKMNNPNKENGLSTSEELDVLGQIEDSLVEKLKRKHNCIYVARATTDGNRDFYFWFTDTTFYDKSISETMVQFPKYTYNFGTKVDKEWKSYFDFLYPLPRQLQSIQNRNVVEQLEQNGDKLTKSREVNHWIYFKSENDRTKFITKIQPFNFKIESLEFDKSLGEYSYKLRISRVDKVDYESIDEYCIYLWEIANECNGDYDGWETSIEKD